MCQPLNLKLNHMKNLNKWIIQILATFLILGAGLLTGGFMNANATTDDCIREACNGGQCDRLGNMTTCQVDDGMCSDGPCGPPPIDF
jgi:hypothetical protein